MNWQPESTARRRVVTIGEPMAEFSALGKERYGLSYSGDAVNVAVSSSRLGFHSSILSSVGEDYFGRSIIKHLDWEGVDTSGIRMERGGYTGAYFITLTGQGGHEFTYFRRGSSASNFAITEKELRIVEKGSILHVSGIAQAIGPRARRSVLAAAKRASTSGVVVSYDVNFRPSLWNRESALSAMDEISDYVDILFVSSEDWSLMRGDDMPAEKIARRLTGEGYGTVIVKSGAKGSFGTDGTKRHRQRSYPVRVIDATGAGDAFDAGFICASLSGLDFAHAMEYASVNAGLKCTRKGGIRGLPTFRQLETALAAISNT